MKPTDHNKQLYRNMQEEPDKYSDQELEAMMDDLDQVPDVAEAWQQFNQLRMPSVYPIHTWRKIAAVLICILMISGLTFAAIHIARQVENPESHKPAVTTAVTNIKHTPVSSQLPEDTVTMQSITFDNVLFGKILSEMADYYQVEAVFQNEEARKLRFYFVWYKNQPIDKVVGTLNHFEKVNIVIDDKKLIVR